MHHDGAGHGAIDGADEALGRDFGVVVGGERQPVNVGGRGPRGIPRHDQVDELDVAAERRRLGRVLEGDVP